MTRRTILSEGLDYHDLEGQLKPVVSVDEYAAKAGNDADIVTLAFIVNSKLAGSDLVEWFEKGYEWVLDASVSDGEIAPGKYVVFVEMNRRSTVPGRIVELLHDLETLTDMRVSEWTVEVDDAEYPAEAEVLSGVIEISPHAYREKHPEEDSTESSEEDEGLNEMRHRAGIDTVKSYGEPDSELRAFIAKAGL